MMYCPYGMVGRLLSALADPRDRLGGCFEQCTLPWASPQAATLLHTSSTSASANTESILPKALHTGWCSSSLVGSVRAFSSVVCTPSSVVRAPSSVVRASTVCGFVNFSWKENTLLDLGPTCTTTISTLTHQLITYSLPVRCSLIWAAALVCTFWWTLGPV